MTGSAVPSRDATLIERERLYELLDTTAQVVLVHAEGGAGKTTLVGQWLRRLGRPAPVWIALDEHSSTPGSFWYRVAQALAAAFPSDSETAIDRYLTGGYGPDEAPSLIAETINLRQLGIRLVLDDLHLLDDEAQVELVRLLRQAPGLRLVGLTRTRTRLDDAAVTGTLVVHTIDSRTLAMTTDELEEIARQAGIDLAGDTVDLLAEATGGHALSARLSVSAIRAQSLFDRRPERYAEIIRATRLRTARTLFPAQLDSEEARRAIRLALAPRVDRELAVAITGNEDIWDVLSEYERQGYGSFGIDGERTVFQFHALVAAALRDGAPDALDTAEQIRVRSVAALGLAGWGDPVDVIQLMLEAGLDEQVWPFFVRELSPLTMHRVDDVIRVLEPVAVSRLRRTGTLALCLAVELSEREARPSERVRELARWGLEYLDARASPPGTLDAYLAACGRLAAHRVTRDYDSAAVAGEGILAALHALGAEDRGRVGTAAYTGVLQSMISDILAGLFNRVADLAVELVGDPHPGRRRHAAGLLAYASALDGEMASTQRNLTAVAADLSDSWPASLHAIGWCFARAIARAEQGNTDGALRALEPFAGRVDRFEHWSLVLWTRGFIHLVGGTAAEGADELAASLDRYRGRVASPRIGRRLVAMQADLATARGDLEVAERLLGHPSDDPYLSTALARLLVVSDRQTAARELLIADREHGLPPRVAAERELLLAAAAMTDGLPAEAQAALRRGMGIAGRNGLTSPFATAPLAPLLPVFGGLGLTLPPRLGRAFEGLRPSPRANGIELTRRERVILGVLARESSITTIASELFVSPNTVKTQLRSLYQKLGAHHREEAVAIAVGLGLLAAPEA